MTSTKQTKKYRLLAGSHIGHDPRDFSRMTLEELRQIARDEGHEDHVPQPNPMLEGDGKNMTPDQLQHREMVRRETASKLKERGERMYGPGDVIEDAADLCELFNKKGFPPKFALHDGRATGLKRAPNETIAAWKRRLQEEMNAMVAEEEARENGPTEGGAEKPRPDFGRMNVAELHSFAEENGIDIGSAETKAEIIKAIKAAALQPA